MVADINIFAEFLQDVLDVLIKMNIAVGQTFEVMWHQH
jgi:hypothetical protein